MLTSYISSYIINLACMLASMFNISMLASIYISMLLVTALIVTVLVCLVEVVNYLTRCSLVFGNHVSNYSISTSLNWFYAVGFVLTTVMVLMLVSGLVLSGTSIYVLNTELMNYYHDAHTIVTIHSIGSSVFMLLIVFHVVRSLVYGSYLSNANVYVKGLLIYLLAMAACFLGYSCNLALMAYWALQVVLNLLQFIG